MPENKMNWGTLILGVIIGAVVVGVIWFASKPGATEGQEAPLSAAFLTNCQFAGGAGTGTASVCGCNISVLSNDVNIRIQNADENECQYLNNQPFSAIADLNKPIPR